MVTRERRLSIAGIGLLCLIATGCGEGAAGSGDTTQSPPQPPTPTFTVSLSPAAVTLAQGSTGQAVQVSVTAQNGFAGSVSVTVGTLPSGVGASPASLSLTPGTVGTFTLSASSTAAVVQQSIDVDAVAGTLSVDTSLQLTVTALAFPDPFHAIGGTLVHGFYDESRQLLFAANPGLNELDVISGQDFSVKARVPVPQPWGVDQMADGETLVIGTQAQEIITVNENTLAVTQHPYSASGGGFYGLFFPNVVAMANGKVLIIGAEQGIDSDDILDGGQYLYEWDSNANTFSQFEPSPQTVNGTWETDSLARSADHKWAIFSADQFYLYSSDSDSLASTSLNTVNPPDNLYGVRGYAINANGTEIAVASATQVTFLNQSFAVLGSTSLPGSFQSARTSVQFTADGSTLLLQYDLPLAIEEVNASTFAALGSLSGDVQPDDNVERLLATDAEGHAYVGISNGLRLVNLGQTAVPNLADGFGPDVPTCPSLDAVLPLNTSQQVQNFDPIPGYSIYVGGMPASVLDGGNEIGIPASSTAGPVDVECEDASGDTSVLADGVSYGLSPIAFSANLLPPTGNPLAYLLGVGFYDSTELGYDTNPPFAGSVSVGGQPAKNAITLGSFWPGTAFEDLAFNIPNGSPGESPSIQVSSSFGSATLPAAATYYPTPTIVPATGLLQLVYDTHRNLLYALKATEVDVLNPTTLKWQPPLPFPAAATGTYNTMELTPDGTKLVVSGEGGTNGTLPQLIVLDPDSVSPASVFTYPGNSFFYASLESIAITEFNTVVMPPSLVFDLSTSTFAPLPVFYSYFGVVRATPDGSHLYSALLDSSSGEVFSIDPATLAAQTQSFGELFWSDLAVSPDGSQFAAVQAPPYAVGDNVGFFNSNLQYLNTNAYPNFSPPDDTGVPGATYSPGGKVLVVPLGDSIEFWDAVQGTLRARLMTPEELNVLVFPEGPVAPRLALDPTGQTIYAISASGLTVINLPEPLDQISPMQWPLTVRSSDQQPWLHGSITSRMAAMRSKSRN